MQIAPDEWMGRMAERHWDRMVDTAMWTGRGRDSAEGIAQQAMVVALARVRRNPELAETIARPGAWLVAMTRSTARDVGRKERRRRRIRRENEESICETLFPVQDPGWDIDWLCQRALDVADRLLKGRQLEVVRCMIDGLTDREIATLLGIAPATVRVHRRNALRVLREGTRRSGATRLRDGRGPPEPAHRRA